MAIDTRATRLADGLCQICGTRPVALGLKACRPCLDDVRTYSAKRHKEWRLAGLCGFCGGKPASHRNSCQKCLDRNTVNRRNHQAEWRAEGLCFLCGDECAPGRTMCRKHFEYHQEYERRRKQKVKSAKAGGR